MSQTLTAGSETHGPQLKAASSRVCCLTAHVLDGWRVLQDAAPQLSRLEWLQVQIGQRSAATGQHRRAAAHAALSGACLQAEKSLCEQDFSGWPSLKPPCFQEQ